MGESDNKAFWQRFAKLYGPAMKGSASLYGEICRRMTLRLSPDMEVLELACGSGQLSFPLAPLVHSWTATDFSEAMVAEAEKRPAPAQLHFAVRDATALPEADGSFDAVVIANALHIMPQPEQALREIFRVLKPGGLLLAPTFIRPGNTAGAIRMRIMGLGGFRTYHSWDGETFPAFLQEQGFTVEKVRVLGGGMMPLCYAEARKPF